MKTPFAIIAITETWLESDNYLDFLFLNDYEFCHKNRLNKKGCVVAIYVHKTLNFKMQKNMSMVIDDVMESITIELCINNKRNVIVSCVYRTPGSNVDIFNEHLEIMIRKVSNPNKSMFLCGDFNLDLLNLPTKRFIDMMFSLGMFPLISKPSRITDVSATLIDNIFTNELTYTITSGLLINDISDHLPVFAICRYQ